jgi:hypothetical protein
MGESLHPTRPVLGKLFHGSALKAVCVYVVDPDRPNFW